MSLRIIGEGDRACFLGTVLAAAGPRCCKAPTFSITCCKELVLDEAEKDPFAASDEFTAGLSCVDCSVPALVDFSSWATENA